MSNKAVLMPLSTLKDAKQLHEFLTYVKKAGKELSENGKETFNIWAMMPVAPGAPTLMRSPFGSLGFGVAMHDQLRDDLIASVPSRYVSRLRKLFAKSESDWLADIEKVRDAEAKEWQIEEMVAFRILANQAKDAGLKLYADLPFYLSGESYMVKAQPELFVTNKAGEPCAFSGVVADEYFDAQFWGHPIYDWENAEAKVIKLFIRRLENLKNLGFAGTRIDHGNGFYRYGYFRNSSENGKMLIGPGNKVVKKLLKVAKSLKMELWWEIVAKDNGQLVSDLDKLSQPTVFDYSTHISAHNPSVLHLPPRTVCYTSTHDTWSLLGALERANRQKHEDIIHFNRLRPGQYSTNKILATELIKMFYNSADLTYVVVPIWDLRLEDFRLNTPGTEDKNNWNYDW